MGILIGLKVSYEFPVVALHTISISACGACSEVVFEFQWRETCFGSFRAKPIFAPLGMPKWVWPSMNWYRMFFAQTSTLPLSMHRKLTERGGCCMQNNNCVQNSQPKVMLSWRITLLVQNLTPGEIFTKALEADISDMSRKHHHHSWLKCIPTNRLHHVMYVVHQEQMWNRRVFVQLCFAL